MGGVLLDYPAKRILNEGLAAGRKAGLAEGRLEGALEMCIGLLKDGVISMAEAAKRLSMTEEELKSKMS